jgi:hypothetical protein
MLEFYWETLLDWPLGTVLAILLAAVVLMLAFMLYLGVYHAADSWFLPHQQAPGHVVGKTFTPAHTTTTLIYNAATKSSMPHVTHHPDSWSVTVQVDDKVDEMDVSKEFYDAVRKNTGVATEYVIGRFSRGLYLRELSLR